MLGSLVDAEDLLQETLAAAWRGLDGHAGRSSLRVWLYRVATNRCLNAIRDVKRRSPVEPVPPFDPPEPSRRGAVTWLQPYPDAWLEQIPDDLAPGPAARYEARETIELAFIAALQRLPPRQTAALLLCDVLGFATAEAATMLDASPTAVKGALQRARATLDRETAAPRPSRRRRTPARPRRGNSHSASPRPSAARTSTASWRCSPRTHGWPCRPRLTSTTVQTRWRPSCAPAPTGAARVACRSCPPQANTQPAFGLYLKDPSTAPPTRPASSSSPSPGARSAPSPGSSTTSYRAPFGLTDHLG